MEKILIGMLRIADLLWNNPTFTLALFGVITAAALIVYTLKGRPLHE